MMSMDLPSHLGILGGTFNPIHLGHVHAAQKAKALFHLDRVLLIPSSIPPHKEDPDVAAAQHRLRMVELAVADIPALEASPLEIESPGPSYSIHTLDRLNEEYPASRIFFILGIDAFLEIETWREYRRVLSRCAFIVMSRPGYNLEDAHGVLGGELKERFVRYQYGDDPRSSELPDLPIFVAEIEALDIASSRIRELVRENAPISGMVAGSVDTYIKEHGLYKMNPETLPEEITRTVAASQDKKAEEILVLDLRGISSFTDYFIIMTGNSGKQNQAILEGIEQALKSRDIRPLSVEGKTHAEWVLMDYGSFIVHIFLPTAREYYALEKLWGDGIKHTF
jgi:nicotinate-nucleotide adenylyltransferase